MPVLSQTGTAPIEVAGASGFALPNASNLDDQIFVRIKTMIVNGSLLPGERIVPEQLAREMGVSRTPLLSALKRLSQERLITWRSRRGVFVRRLSKRELAMIFEVREVLEGLAARRAAALIAKPQLDQLRSLFSDVDTTDTPANRRSYLLKDYLFHSGILEIAGSPPLTEATHSVSILVLAFGAGLIKSIEDGLTEHAAIFDALAKRDPEAAEAAMRAHVHRSAVWLHHEADLLEGPQVLPIELLSGIKGDHISISNTRRGMTDPQRPKHGEENANHGKQRRRRR